jgi:phospholipase/carboxylesterase
VIVARRALSATPLLLAMAAPACKSHAHANPSAAPTSERPAPSSDPKRGVAASVEYLEMIVGGAEDTDGLPSIVCIHGRGDRPENWISFWREAHFRARVILPRGPEDYGSGFAWFPPPRSIESMSAAEGDLFARDLAKATDRLHAMIRELSARRPSAPRPFVTGFSQGGMLAFALAVRAGDDIAASFPISGFLPRQMLPRARGSDVAPHIAPLTAFHGEDDPRMPIARTREVIEALRDAGGMAELQTYSGIGHEVSPEMKSDLDLAIRKHLRN